jgi:hypothetical protein
VVAISAYRLDPPARFRRTLRRLSFDQEPHDETLNHLNKQRGATNGIVQAA